MRVVQAGVQKPPHVLLRHHAAPGGAQASPHFALSRFLLAENRANGQLFSIRGS
jgi:hypothetical protein